MIAILTTLAVFAVLGFAVWSYMLQPAIAKGRSGDKNTVFIIAVIAAAFIVRVICAVMYKGHQTDMNCFTAWSDMIFRDGISNFYKSDAFHDYPPGYMYILYILGAVRHVFNPQNGGLYLLIKLPSIITDLLSGFFIYKIAKKKFGDGISSLFAAIYLFNPAVILNSSLWGQIDTIYTLLIAVIIYLISEKRMILSYFVFAVCIFVKPQAFIFTPLIIYGIIENVFIANKGNFKLKYIIATLIISIINVCIYFILLPYSENWALMKVNSIFFVLLFAVLSIIDILSIILLLITGSKKFRKDFLTHLGYGLGAILMIFILSLPFGLGNVFDQYKATLASYPYLTVNAFNIWGVFGKNWTGLTTFTAIIGYIILAAIVAYATYVFFKSKNKGRYFFVGALLSISTFMLSTKMHDRYAFPTMMLLLMTFLTTEKAEDYLLYILTTLSQFFNTSWVLFIYETDINHYFRSPVVNIASIINVVIYAYLIYIAQKHYVSYNPKLEAKAAAVKAQSSKSVNNTKTAPSKPQSSVKFTLSSTFAKVTKFDIIAMIIITAVYSCIAFYDLGDMQAPESEIALPEQTVTIDLGKDTDISKIKFYLGSYELNEQRNISIKFKNSANAVVSSDNYTSGAVFYWSEKEINKNARYITLSTNADKLTIKEFAVMDNNGNYVVPANASDESIANLFDEQSMIPERTSFRNSTYFDEIYHGRTGYEFVHSLSVYEWTHPPLGKVFIALGVLLFGMCPFGWRVAGTVFGIIMLPILYMFAKRITNKSWLSVVTCLLFTFDFMHFAQTRIATIDVYITTFVILMYYFMYKYYCTSFYDTPFKKTLVPLALSGVFMGLGIASKWTGIYAGIGLAVLFFMTIYKRYSEYLYASKRPSGETNGISHKFIIDNFTPYFIKTIIWCCIFFILVPLAIYVMSYIPYLKAPDAHGIKTIIDNQNSMYTYHSSTVLGSTHPFSSRWYEWIIMKRPIWYYSGTVSDGIKEGISSFGNPLVWWLGIPAFLYMAYTAIRKKDKIALFLVIGYLAQLVSWIPVTRLTFIYHYFPCVPFIVLMLGYSINLIYEEAKNKKSVIIGAFVYAGLVIVLFAMFYPVLSGQPVSTDYVQTFLKWFDSWVLI